MESVPHNIVEELVKGLRTKRDWVQEINNLSLLLSKLDEMDKAVSVRTLGRLLNRSKSWIGVSMILLKGMKLYPEIEKMRTRNHAYVFLLKKNKLKRFLES